MIGIDPQLADPENNDFTLLPGSPAQGYGCQTFRQGSAGAIDSPPTYDSITSYDRLTRRARRGSIQVSGSIIADTLWDAEKVEVLGSVFVENGVTLTIAPGVRVEFQDYYTLGVSGTLLAEGTPEHRILFTTDEPELFTVNTSHAGCWNAIRFDETLASNDPSRLSFCTIEYSKSAGGGAGLYPYGGGALSVTEYSGLSVENCIFRNNVGEYGGAVFLYRHGDVKLTGNLFVNNHALENAAALYCAYSYPKLVNNTITDNTIRNETNPYIDSCALLNFLGKPLIVNNIVRKNDPEVVYLHYQLLCAKEYYVHFNNIENHEIGGGNIDADPLFIDPEGGNYGLAMPSPCIDAGYSDSPYLPNRDVEGDPRIVPGLTPAQVKQLIIPGGVLPEGTVDMGADELCLIKIKKGPETIH